MHRNFAVLHRVEAVLLGPIVMTALISIQAMREATAPQQFTPPFPPLALVTKPTITTAELAYYSNMAEQTWRVKACYDTVPDGLRPLRVCGRLAWPTAGAKRLLGVTA